MSSQTAYITTPIYYVNDKPHLGHVYTTTVCDIWARFMRFAGRDVFFLTGTDEHGMKVEKSARERGITPQQLADQNSAEFRRVMAMLGFTFDRFIRTSEEDHERQVEALVSRLLQTDAVYLGEFEGWYDEGQEEYYTDTTAKDLEFKSPIDRRPLVRAKEKNYYFRLSDYQQRLEEVFRDQPDFVCPESRRNEVLGRLRLGLQDVPISRTNFSWGIKMPGDPDHVIYVWIDALMNYITALNLGDPKEQRETDLARFWPADYHVIAKDILWFHAVIWPAVLMALKLPLPRHIYCHSWWISEGQKMSKSLGNAIDLPVIGNYLEHYGHDMWRYYLAVQGPLGATDSDFRAARFHETYTTDLVNTLGNCVSRVTAMTGKYCGGAAPRRSDRVIDERNWPSLTASAVERSFDAMEKLDLGTSIGAAMQLVRDVDRFINDTAPFKLAKDPARSEDVEAILYQCLETLRIASLLLWAVMPGAMGRVWDALGSNVDPQEGRLRELTAWGRLEPGTAVDKIALFPRIEPVEHHEQVAGGT